MVSWKLTIEDDQGQKALMPLVGDEYTLGRDSTNAVHLPERNISRRHATLKLTGEARWSLVDHDSYNGVYVNGQRVAGEATLSNADLIQLGDYRISLQAEGDASTKIATIPPAAAVRPDRLVVLVGPNPGVEFPLDGGGEVAIGRAEECAVSINHPSVSRVHARIQKLANGRYEVIDQGSANGLRVNGVDLARKVLEAGDMIELGDVKLRFLERGQQLRPGAADVSQQLTVASSTSPELSGSAHVSGAPGAYAGDVAAPSGGSIVTKVVIGVVVAAVAVGGLLALRPSDPAPTTGDPKAPPSAAPSASVADDPAAKTLAEAQAAADANDFTTMLAKLDELPPAFKDSKRVETSKLYAKWAEATIAKAKATKDPAEAKTLLGSVAQSDYAPLDQRNSARDALAKLPADKTAATATTRSDPPPATTKSDPAPAKTTSKTASGDGTIGADDVLSEEKRKRAKAGLEGRVASGKASTGEIRMLKALCQSDGDKACVARANAALAKGAE
jgi:ABC transport system ATP-binding/permease protein